VNGFEIHRCYDEYGPIHVFEEGPYRYMTFGEGGEQSRILIEDPAKPVYQYTQAMLLALLFQPEPQQIIMLGLGAGSLANALLKHSDKVLIDTVELRPMVLDVAQRWFHLSTSSRLTIHLQNAVTYMDRNQQRSDKSDADLIFTDIYSDRGMQYEQIDPDFILNCYESLSDKGVLILNLWDEGKGFHPLARERLCKQFGDQWVYCPIDSGNLIVFAFKGGCPEISSRRLMPLANRLGKQLDIPLRQLLNHLQHS